MNRKNKTTKVTARILVLAASSIAAIGVGVGGAAAAASHPHPYSQSHSSVAFPPNVPPGSGDVTNILADPPSGSPGGEGG